MAFSPDALRTVALKLFVLATDGSGSQGSGSHLSSNSESQRILEEARALCRVELPNVVRFHSIAYDPRTTASLAWPWNTWMASHLIISSDSDATMSTSFLSTTPSRWEAPGNIVETHGVYKFLKHHKTQDDARAGASHRHRGLARLRNYVQPPWNHGPRLLPRELSRCQWHS